jgi:hypothetical protein
MSHVIPRMIFLDQLPPVPDELLDYDFDLEDYFFGIPERRICTKNGVDFPAGLHRRQDINEDLAKWLKDNIIPDWYSAGFGRDVAPCNGPHVDRSARYKLLYLIEPGGNNVETVFWEPKNNKCSFTVNTMFFNNYDDLEKVETYVLKPKQWVILYGSYGIHSVENIESTRVTLQLGLQKDPYSNFF